MHLCQIVPSLEERYGGPSRSVLALSRALADAGDDVSLLATHPHTASEHADGRFNQHVFLRDAPGALCPSRDLRRRLDSVPCDVVHHHSIWLRTLHYAHRRAKSAGVPLVISPRGMMSAWAWNHRGWRKQIARAFLHPGAFESAAGWHATSDEEAAEIRALGFNQPVCVAPNGVAAPTDADLAVARAHWRTACPEVDRRPTAVFYSRLHRKKRVLELIDVWLERAPADWLLLVVGLPEDYRPEQLEAYVMRASGAGRVRVFDGRDRPAPYAVGSLFLLPSHSENFGLVVAEAMAHGVPVLTTDTTPWRTLDSAGAGWCVSWDNYAAALVAALAEPPAALADRGARARTHVLANYSWQHAAHLLAAFYRELRDRRSHAPA